MDFKLILQVAVIVVTPVSAVLWALVKFGGEKLVKSLDKNTAQMAEFTLKLQKVGDEVAFNAKVNNLNLESQEKRFAKLEDEIDDLDQEQVFQGDRMHDIITVIGNLHFLAKENGWPLPDDSPGIRARRKK